MTTLLLRSDRQPSALDFGAVRGDQFGGLQLLGGYVVSDFFWLWLAPKFFEISPLNGDIATCESTAL